MIGRTYPDLPVDWSVLMMLADDDVDFAQELLQIYVDDCGSYMESMGQAIVQGDYDRLYSTAHYLKGSSSNVGAVGIVDASHTLELLARSHCLGDAPALYGQIQQDVQRISQWLQTRSLS